MLAKYKLYFAILISPGASYNKKITYYAKHWYAFCLALKVKRRSIPAETLKQEAVSIALLMQL